MDNSLTRQHTARSLLAFAMPTIIMTVFMSLYTMVDGIFVANFVSAEALAGLNLVIPGLSILVAFSVLISAGGSVVISRKLGEDKLREAQEDLSAIVLFTVIFGAAVTVLALIFAKPVLTVFGTTAPLYSVAFDYYQTLAMFAVPCLLQVQFQYFFVTAGVPLLGLVCVVAGGVSNVILDFVFIVPLNMGIRGAALATGVGYSIPAVIGLVWLAFRKNTLLHFVPPRFRLAAFQESVINGTASMITNLAGAMVTWLYNRIIYLYLGEMGISATTIVLYARYLFNSVLSGYSSGVAPVVSYNFGKQNFHQVKLLFRTSLRVVFAGSVLVLVVSSLFSGAIVSLFCSGDSDLYTLSQHGILLFSISYLFNGINTFAATLFSSLNNGKLSAFMTFLHTFVFLTAALLILPRLGLGADGVWLGVPVAEFLSLLFTMYLLKKHQTEYDY